MYPTQIQNFKIPIDEKTIIIYVIAESTTTKSTTSASASAKSIIIYLKCDYDPSKKHEKRMWKQIT